MMIKCGECGAEISDSAIACPKCGAKTALAKRQDAGNVRAMIFIGCTVLISAIVWFVVDDLQKKARMEDATNMMRTYMDMERESKRAKEIGEGAANAIQTYTEGEVRQKLYERESESGSMVERPITDDVLGDEYRLKECNGVWEVYKGEVSTGMKAIDRNECLKYVKSLRGL